MKVKTSEVSGHILERQEKQVLFQRMYNKLYAFVRLGSEVYWTPVTEETLEFVPRLDSEEYPDIKKAA
jgi:hypothetical protein